MKLIWHDAVRRDVVAIVDYLATQSADAADRFPDAMEASLRFLRQNPRAGDLKPHFRGRLSDLRTWRVEDFGNYVIYYTLRPDGLFLVGVLHGARRVGGVLRSRLH